MKKCPGSGTLLMSVLMSAPGPIVVGIGLILGRSSTQLADFLRRSAELIAIIVSYFVFILSGADNADPDKKAKYERRSNIVVGAMMCISGAAMLIVALFSSSTDTGRHLIPSCPYKADFTERRLWWIAVSPLHSPALCCSPRP